MVAIAAFRTQIHFQIEDRFNTFKRYSDKVPVSVHRGAECHRAIDCPKYLAAVVAIRQWLWQALEKE